jgi:hypothetical protein
LENPGNHSSPISETAAGKFVLSWSHYLKLMRISNPDERHFYEIECAANNWSLKNRRSEEEKQISRSCALRAFLKVPEARPTSSPLILLSSHLLLFCFSCPYLKNTIFSYIILLKIKMSIIQDKEVATCWN